MLLDVGGQDATEAFEDVGHSDEAREILEGLLVGKLKRKVYPSTPSSSPLPIPIPTLRLSPVSAQRSLGSEPIPRSHHKSRMCTRRPQERKTC